MNQLKSHGIRCLSIFTTLALTACSNQFAGPASSRPNDVAISQRDSKEALFNSDWKFSKGDDATAKDPSFNDATWRTVQLPHDWSIESDFDQKLASATAFLPTGVAWYRRSFVLPADMQGKSVRVRFDGVMNHSTVWCNGHQLSERPYGYSSFTDDLTPVVHFDGKPNVIAVRVDHEQYADSRWYAGSGIDRNVFLIVTDKVHVDSDGTFVATPKVSADAAEVNIQTTVRNDDTLAAPVNVETTIEDPAGHTVATMTQAASVPAGESKLISSDGSISMPSLWSPDHPAMYSAVTRIKRGDQLVDQYTTPFGIRSFTFDPAKGFSIDGQTLKLKGVCVHHDAGVLGAAVPIEVWQRRLTLLREAGCNAIRCSHNPPAPEFLDLCDRMGFLVMDEAFDEWTRGKKKWVVGHNVGTPSYDGYHSDFEKWADRDIQDMVRRDRNHPSIILWSIGNEIDYKNDPYPPNSPELPPIATRLIADVKAVDTSRPVTAACASPDTNLYKSLLDVEGYNYMEKLYAGDHAAHPDRVIYGSENSHTSVVWDAVKNNEYIAGQFLWTGIDYLGETSGWPAHASPSGMLDLAGFKKEQFYFRQSLWTDAPMLHLSTFPLERGRVRVTTAPAPSIYCYTNCDRVELFHDGQSLGEKPQTAEHVIRWPLEFTSGKLHAVGHQGSREVSIDLQHAGAATQLILHPDVTNFTAGKIGLAQIELNVTDADGNVVLNASPMITCALTGPGRLLGAESGNIRSSETYRSPSHSANRGRLMIYVQTLGEPGDTRLTVSAAGFKETSIALPTH